MSTLISGPWNGPSTRVSLSPPATPVTITTATRRTSPCCPSWASTCTGSLLSGRGEPEPGYFSVAALDHYKRMLETCHGLGVVPVVTYNHFTLPRWVAGRGGWMGRHAPERFADFAAVHPALR